jgi:hypothetical protein
MTPPSDADPRLIQHGHIIPTEGYADQPYVVQTDDGAWLCAVTTGPGHEGQKGQHVVTRRSTDHGRTWSDPVAVEPDGSPENSYAVLLKTDSGRVYCFFNYNAENRREVLCEDGKTVFPRVDSLGEYVFRYSDDHGRTWSSRRYGVPVREFACDRDNVYGGAVRFFWNVGRPLVLEDGVLLVLHKVGAMGEGFFAQSEGCFLFSDNILSERDPERVRFETRPAGDIGLRTPEGGGRVAEEHSIARLSDGSIFCIYRTVDGWPACAYSADEGCTWTAPRYLTYSPGGQRRVKNPRAANFVWNCGNGRFLYWFHNHGGRFVREMGGHSSRVNGLSEDSRSTPYDDRNPAWLMAGREVQTSLGLQIEWSQPEIALYDDDPYVRMSYPDLIEQDGRFWVTETQKKWARVHELDGILLAGLFNQWDSATRERDALLLELPGEDGHLPGDVAMPVLPDFMTRDWTDLSFGRKELRQGFSIEIEFELASLSAGQVLIDSRTPYGKGIALQTTDRQTVELVMNDGRSETHWDCDPGLIQSGQRHHLVVTVDGGPRIIIFVVDGQVCDGGDFRQFGWGRFTPHLHSVTGGRRLRLGPTLQGQLQTLRIYGRALRVSEAVAHWRAARRQAP